MPTLTVTTTNDSGAGSLRAAIAQAQSGDTIQFSSNLQNQTIALTSGELVIPNDKDLIIDGSGVSGLSISGNGRSRIFNVTSTYLSLTQFTVKNLILTSASTNGRGGAVYASDQAQLKFDGVTFRNNTANGGGASIYTNRGSVWVNNSTFENNRATANNDERGSAGITAVEATEVTVLNSLFMGNKGINGAAINTLNSKLTVRGSRFLNNDVLSAYYASNDPNGNNFLRGYGGAIYTDRASDSTIIEDSVFENNTSKAAGGAVYLFNDPEDVVSITDTGFRNNKAIGLAGGEAGNGGAVEHQRNALGSGSLTLRDVSFVSNEAYGQGSALRERNANTSIANATVAQNRVYGNGYSNNGGLEFSGAGTVNLLNSTLAYNRAGWVGGGISAQNSVQVNLQNTIFYENSADNGGNPWGILQHSNRQLTDWGGNFQWEPGVNSDSNVTNRVTIADVKLGDLQQAGNLWVYPLLAGSPAINAAVGNAPMTDIRGAVRVGNADSGSYEFGSGNPDPAPAPVSLTVSDASVTESNGTKMALVTVNLSAASTQAVSVNYVTANGSAIAGSDYTALSGSLTFSPGETSKTISVPILGDGVLESTESFAINLSQPRPEYATIADSQGIITILNDDVAPPLPRLSINDKSLVEGNDGSLSLVFTVSLSAASNQGVSVNYATADDSAIAGSDYSARSGSLSFNPGETSKTIAVAVSGDTLVEATESFWLNLSGASNATIADAQGIGTILNDDIYRPDPVPAPTPVLSINNVTLAEGHNGDRAFVFTVSLSHASNKAVSVNYTTQDETATAGLDYLTQAGLLTFNPGETTQTISVGVIGDFATEAIETFMLQLSNPLNAIYHECRGWGSILNDDVIPAGGLSTLGNSIAASSLPASGSNGMGGTTGWVDPLSGQTGMNSNTVL